MNVKMPCETETTFSRSAVVLRFSLIKLLVTRTTFSSDILHIEVENQTETGTTER